MTDEPGDVEQRGDAQHAVRSGRAQPVLWSEPSIDKGRRQAVGSAVEFPQRHGAVEVAEGDGLR
ncbi:MULTISPECIES: hypothetical protein [unclassified Streptomyces]|uniref:hypothetical protein n=1 Tax=unclassified Streptomyces TaxID=2593676 RepID=UPI0036E92DFE